MDTTIIDELIKAYKETTKYYNRFQEVLDGYILQEEIKYSFTCEDEVYYDGKGFWFTYWESEKGNHMSMIIGLSFDDCRIPGFDFSECKQETI